jgi:hypothetical protein
MRSFCLNRSSGDRLSFQEIRGKAVARFVALRATRMKGLKRQSRTEPPLPLLVWPERRRDVTESRAVHIRIGKIEVCMVR